MRTHKGIQMIVRHTSSLFFLLMVHLNLHTASLDPHSAEKSIVVVILSRNNNAVCRENLTSVFMQHYKRYVVIYVDDASDDGTATTVENIITEYKQWHRSIFIRNEKRKGHMYNHYNVIHRCPNDAIIVNLDGDDRFAHNNVLSCINEIYQDDNVWMTYGQYKEWPSGKKGVCRKIPDIIREYNAYRYFDWVTSHPRTFYAGLFKKIPVGYFLYESSFLPSAVDYAMMFSMLELSGGRAQFIDEILYLYNCANPENIFKKAPLQQIMMGYLSRGRKPLQALKHDPRYQIPGQQNAHSALICFSTHGIRAAKEYMADTTQNNLVLPDMYLLYDTNNQEEQDAYDELSKKYQSCYSINIHGPNILKDTLLKLCARYSHILLCTDEIRINCPTTINIQNAIQLLEKSCAIGFYFGKSSANAHNTLFVDHSLLPIFVEIENSVYAWKFRQSNGDWMFPYNTDFSLYRAEDLAECIKKCACTNYTEFNMALHMIGALEADDVGLCYAHPCVTSQHILLAE
jgi:glycosyltransferase involved in cell wall biosynthesis